MPHFLALLLMVATTATSTATAADTVVLLHGLGRTSWSMSHLASALAHDGYRVVNLNYPSRSVPLETLAHDWLPQQLRTLGLAAVAGSASRSASSESSAAALDSPSPDTPTPRVHFVTHSMGGILVRLWLRDCGAPANLGRVVMLAPPNAGSELTDRLNTFPPFRWFTGANGRRLGTAATDLPRTLGPWPTVLSSFAADAPALGIIAADRSLNPLFSALLPGPDDGKVTVASTRLAGMADHLVLPYSHTWLAWHAETARQIRAFLVDGHFRPVVAESF